MGYTGKLLEKKKARTLRVKGHSHTEISQKVSVSKGSISRWCRDIELSKKQIKNLQRKQHCGSYRGRLLGANRQKEARIKNTRELLNKGMKRIGFLSKRDFFIAGAALYLGDGSKGDSEVGFSNANPEIVRFMMSWLKMFFEIPETRIRGQIWIHDNLDESKAKKFWSKVTGIPQSQFRKSYIAKNIEKSKKIRKNIHSYGVFSIRISSSSTQREIKGLMKGILKST
jgi:hypothetical protein